MDDALILRVIKDMYSSASMEFRDFDGIKYMWINYTYLSKQIPIIGKKRFLMGRIEAYGKKHLLLRVLEKSRKGQKGNFSYISPTEKLDSLQDYDPYAQIAQGTLCTDDISLMHQSHNKDTSTKDTSNVYTIFEFWNKAKVLVHRSMTDKMVGHINSRLIHYSVEEICNSIKNYASILNDEQYYWTYKWTLNDFLVRGMEQFKDESEPFKNFQKNGKGKSVGASKSTEDKSREILARMKEKSKQGSDQE